MTNQNPILNAYFRLPIQMVRGDGAYLFDAEEKQYLDFASGIAVTTLGHNHAHINHALEQQLRTLWHCANLFTIPEQQRFAERLTEKSFADRAFFCSSGLEAVETAIKLIRRYQYTNGHTRRNHIITLENGFHGRSLACLSAGGNDYAREGFGPLLEGFTAVPAEDIAALEAAITDHTAGILLEPVQSEGGVYPLDHTYLREVHALADKHALVLCFDEVQTGFGRTGSLFAYEQIGVTPDILTLAKGIGNGFPLAACLMTDAVAACITPGSHGSTYGGNPLAMAVGNAVLDALESPELLRNAAEISAYLAEQLHALAAEFPSHITAIRGVGHIWGIEVKRSARDYMLRCINAGLIVTKTSNDRVLRLLPPLIITRTQVDDAIAMLHNVFDA